MVQHLLQHSVFRPLTQLNELVTLCTPRRPIRASSHMTLT